MTWNGEERRTASAHCQEEIRLQVKEIDRKVDRIMEAIYGNGEPEKGFIVRMDRLEQAKTALLWVVSIIGVSVIGIIVRGVAEAMGK